MVRGFSESVVIQCEEPEINALNLADNQAVLILLDHCRVARRQECLSRVAMVFLLMSSLAVFFFVRMAPQTTDATVEYVSSAQRDEQRHKPHAHLTVLPPETPSAQCTPEPPPGTMAWEMTNGLAHTYNFPYDQGKRALIVPAVGFYIVYLQITFRTVENHRACKDKTSVIPLDAVVYALTAGSKYDLMVVSETLPCTGHIRRSVSASGLYELKSGTELSVVISDLDVVDWSTDKKTYFGAYLQ